MKVAIIHDWLTGMRGGEKCLEVFCEIFPEADIFTLLHKPDSVSQSIERHRITTSFVQHLPFAQTSYRYYLPLFPLAIERFDFGDYDLVLSSSHCVAKNVRVPQTTCHIAYTYTPMRYVWDQYEAYFGAGRAGLLVRGAMRTARPWLQHKDVAASRGVHYFVAISQHVANRIQRFYGRSSDVIYPPVDTSRFTPSARDDGYYLMVTALAPYKRVDLAIAAFNQLGAPLKIIGSGQDEKRLRELAGPTVELCGWKSDSEVKQAYERCRALVFPGEEDFGIVPVEAMAAGKPVLAFGKGGAVETVIPLNGSAAPDGSMANGKAPTGIFFYEQSVDAIIAAVRRLELERDRFDQQRIRGHAESYNRQRFKTEIESYIATKYAEFRSTGP